RTVGPVPAHHARRRRSRRHLQPAAGDRADDPVRRDRGRRGDAALPRAGRAGLGVRHHDLVRHLPRVPRCRGGAAMTGGAGPDGAEPDGAGPDGTGADGAGADGAAVAPDDATELEAIRAAYPTLTWDSAERIDEGWDHVVMICRGCSGPDSHGHRELVFRFPADDQAHAQLPTEIAVLDHLAGRVDAALPHYS